MNRDQIGASGYRSAPCSTLVSAQQKQIRPSKVAARYGAIGARSELGNTCPSVVNATRLFQKQLLGMDAKTGVDGYRVLPGWRVLTVPAVIEMQTSRT
mmetsp:Transcript_9446/g.10392  ORF Transcript_9446/g.10392 Transcript_9446/m.10392 type:complete len:98 (-) Transcript_9446:46-339(-)